MRRIAGAVVLVCMSVLASACNGDGKSVSTSGTTTTSEAESTTTSAGPCTVAGATVDAKTGAGPDTISLHTDVRTGRQPCADRVVFDFRDGAAPAFDIEYRSGPFTFGESDEPVDVQGGAFLVITFPRASGVDLTTADATQTYTGPESIVPTGVTRVREVRRLSDFEAVLVWVIGVDEMRPFTVGQLTGPPRVYIDIG